MDVPVLYVIYLIHTESLDGFVTLTIPSPYPASCLGLRYVMELTLQL